MELLYTDLLTKGNTCFFDPDWAGKSGLHGYYGQIHRNRRGNKSRHGTWVSGMIRGREMPPAARTKVSHVSCRPAMLLQLLRLASYSGVTEGSRPIPINWSGSDGTPNGAVFLKGLTAGGLKVEEVARQSHHINSICPHDKVKPLKFNQFRHSHSDKNVWTRDHSGAEPLFSWTHIPANW